MAVNVKRFILSVDQAVIKRATDDAIARAEAFEGDDIETQLFVRELREELRADVRAAVSVRAA